MLLFIERLARDYSAAVKRIMNLSKEKRDVMAVRAGGQPGSYTVAEHSLVGTLAGETEDGSQQSDSSSEMEEDLGSNLEEESDSDQEEESDSDDTFSYSDCARSELACAVSSEMVQIIAESKRPLTAAEVKLSHIHM